MARATGLWAEAWTVPGTNGGDISEKKVDWIPVVDGDLFDPLNEVGRGGIRIPGKYENLVEILDPATSSYSLIRVKRPNGTTFGGRTIYSWLAQRFEDMEADREITAIGVTGPGVESMLDVPILPFDYPLTLADGSTVNPDWIWGGENLLRTSENPVGEVVDVWNRATGGNFTLDFGGQVTASIAYNATASQIETILENLSNITNVLVTGTGTETDPWVIEFVDPIGDVTDIIVDTDSLTGGTAPRLFVTVTTRGTTTPAGWEQSQRLDRGVLHVFGRHDQDSPKVVTDVVDSAEGATWSLWWNGLAPPPVYPGVQYRVPVEPGGLYQARVRFHITNTTDVFRFVIRGPMEEFIASYPPNAGQQAAAAANTWEAWTIDDIVIPDGITEIIFRFAYVGLGNPTPVRMNVQTGTWFRKGFNPTTPGDIITTLLNDMTVDHAPGFEAFPFLKHSTFDADNDSNGDAWTQTEISYQAEAGKSMLQVLQDMATLGYSFKVFDLDGTDGTYDLELKVVDGDDIGPDLPGGDTGPNGETDTRVAIVAGANVLPAEVIRSRPAANDIMVQGANGLIFRAEGASIATAGRIGAYISAPELLDMEAVEARATQELATRGVSVSLKPTMFESNEESQSTPYYDFGIGWNVRVNFPNLTSAGRRIYSIGTNWNGEEPAKFVIDTDRRVFSSNAALGMARAVELMWRKFTGRVPQGGGAVTSLPGGGGGQPTIVIAASDASEYSKSKADFICTGVGDEVVINAAINLIASFTADYGLIVLTEGIFNLTIGTQISLTHTIELRGLGMDITWILGGITGDSLIDFNGSSWVALSDCTVDQSLSGDGVSAAGFHNRVSRVHVYALGSASGDCISASASTNLLIEDCVLEVGNDGRCINISSSYMLTVQGNWCESDTDVAPIYFSTCSEAVRYVNNYATAKGRILEIDDSGGSFTFYASGNYYESVSVAAGTPFAIRVDMNTGGNIIAMQFIGETISTAYGGIEIVDAPDGHGMLIMGCTIISAGGGGGHGIHINDSKRVRIFDNQIMGVNATGNTYSAIFLDGDSDRNIIVGNSIHSPTSFTPNTWKYGVRIDASTCNDNIIAENDLRPSSDFGTAQISDAGTGTLLEYPTGGGGGSNLV